VTNVKKGVLWVLTSALAYSMFTVFAKKILEQIRPTDVLFWRFTIAAPIAWAVVLLRRRSGHGPRPMEVAWKPRFAMGLLFGLLAWLAFVGIDNLPGALYVVIIYTYPALVAIGARILGKPASRQIWVAIAITGSLAATKAAGAGPRRRTPKKNVVPAKTVLTVAKPIIDPIPMTPRGACTPPDAIASTVATTNEPVIPQAAARKLSPACAPPRVSLTMRSLYRMYPA